MYIGEIGCKNYQGVNNVREKKCCGGKVMKVAEVNCEIHQIISASDGCREQICMYFEEGVPPDES